MDSKNILQIGFIVIGLIFQHILKEELGLMICFFFILLGTYYYVIKLREELNKREKRIKINKENLPKFSDLTLEEQKKLIEELELTEEDKLEFIKLNNTREENVSS